MNLLYGQKFLGTPFRIEYVMIKNGPGIWDSTKVTIFKDNAIIGEYIRNYYGKPPFYPFCLNNQWYALYSANYKSTRIMKLNDTNIEDWCGEEFENSPGIPLEYYVPRIHVYDQEEGFEYIIADCNEYKSQADFENDIDNVSFTSYLTFGFLSGTSNIDIGKNIKYINLEEVPNKKLNILEKFDGIILPGNYSLRECVNLTEWNDDIPIIKLLTERRFAACQVINTNI